ncbi:PIN-like domain-containing protein [Micromonospora parva]|uniref:PIN-like domain-containing protein n=1 Tax=Micromonospora parva TaxID=1464048 RepID=UPI0037BB17D2
MSGQDFSDAGGSDEDGVVAPLGGIFDGYEGFRQVQPDHLSEAARSSTIVLDTNVLLDLYRSLQQTREENIAKLRKISPRLLMPAQVQSEFWRNRDQVIRDIIERDSAEGLREAQRKAATALTAWGKQTLSKDEANVLRAELDAAFQQVLTKLRSGGHGLKLTGALTDTNLDPILTEIEKLYDKRVGRPFSADRLAELVQEGRTRFARRIPPGYMDAAKADETEEGTGDFLIWEQLVAHARATGQDILFVTRDLKEDWWRLGKLNAPIGPRVELINEMRDRAGVGLLLAEPSQFWAALADAFPELPTSQSTVDDVERLGEEADADGWLPWTAEMWDALLARLEDSSYPIRVAVLREAASSPDGFIPRQRVYDLGGYDQTRLLVGFTKPIIGATRELVANGDLPAGLEPALRAQYLRPGKAEGFLVPPSVVESADQKRATHTRLARSAASARSASSSSSGVAP